MSYKKAISAGIYPPSYRTEALSALGEGAHAGQLDALVWGKDGSVPHLQALVTLTGGAKVCIAAFHQDNGNGGLPYSGFRNFKPGMLVNVVISIGSRGGIKAMMENP